LSSPRCVEAVLKAVNVLSNDWSSKIGYVVGESTYKSAEGLPLVAKGQQCGNAEALGKLIVEGRDWTYLQNNRFGLHSKI